MRKVYFLFLLYLFLTSTAFAGSVALPQTGQTTCYDTSGNVTNCTGTGQDGESQAGVSWPSPRFTKNADMTITDNLTGLVWVPDGNIMPVQAPGWDPDGSILDGKVTWQHALDYVAKLNAEKYLGHNDWRLPNVNELESLINAGEIDSSNWLNTQGFTNVKPDYYWSSTSYSNVTLYAWLVYMVDGYVDGYDKSSDDFYVWPLRAGQDNSSPAQLWKTGQTKCYEAAGTEITCTDTGQDGAMQTGVAWPSQRFVDHGDGTVTDNLTGLMWTKNANICCPNPLSGGIPWQDAQSLVSGMNAGSSENYGYTDWRIPNRVELHSLTDFSRFYPPDSLPSGHPFVDIVPYYYWSSTIVVYPPQSAWYVDMFDGYIYWQMFNEVNGGYLWPVRTGQASGPGCSTWADVIGKYNSYVSGQAGWTDVISCYNGYASK